MSNIIPFPEAQAAAEKFTVELAYMRGEALALKHILGPLAKESPVFAEFVGKRAANILASTVNLESYSNEYHEQHEAMVAEVRKLKRQTAPHVSNTPINGVVSK